jgi:periplasmic divalent cation tolerance protein
MIDGMIVLVSCASREEAGKIAEVLVQERLAACVNVVSSVESCYRWEDKVGWDSEYLLVIKTMAGALDRCRQRTLEIHSYDLPEFIAFKIDAGSAPYLKWIDDSVDS